MELELGDARDALDYWERRTRTLPRWAVRRRREAREMAVRWQARVAQAERDAYGRGLVGALVMLASEGRLPANARHAGRTLVHHARRAALLVLTAVIALLVIGAYAAVELVSAIF
jgi:hypothetical protein